jgi:hypothetical protein
MNRKFPNITVWNEVGGVTSVSTFALSGANDDSGDGRTKSTGSGSGLNTISAAAASAIKTNENLQRILSKAAHNVEVFNNLFTFADSRVSLVLFGFLFIASILASIWISIFSVRNLLSKTSIFV